MEERRLLTAVNNKDGLSQWGTWKQYSELQSGETIYALAYKYCDRDFLLQIYNNKNTYITIFKNLYTTSPSMSQGNFNIGNRPYYLWMIFDPGAYNVISYKPFSDSGTIYYDQQPFYHYLAIPQNAGNIMRYYPEDTYYIHYYGDLVVLSPNTPNTSISTKSDDLGITCYYNCHVAYTFNIKVNSVQSTYYDYMGDNFLFLVEKSSDLE